jgi:hypothetical protein
MDCQAPCPFSYKLSEVLAPTKPKAARASYSPFSCQFLLLLGYRTGALWNEGFMILFQGEEFRSENSFIAFFREKDVKGQRVTSSVSFSVKYSVHQGILFWVLCSGAHHSLFTKPRNNLKNRA